jgi:DNA repair exonuclease SbcCD ATPase subunit
MKNNTEAFNTYLSTMSELSHSLRKLRNTEDQMTEAAATNQPGQLDEIVKNAQPELLHFRGLDRTRLQCEKELGIVGRRPEDILSDCNEEQNHRLQPVLSELIRELKLFRESHDNADRVMKIRLLDVNIALQDLPVKPVAFHDTLA